MRPLARLAPRAPLLLAALLAFPVAASPLTPTFDHQWKILGNGPGQVLFPGGLHADPSGDLWAVDPSHQKLHKFDGAGNWLFTVGSFGSGNGQFNSPHGIAGDAAGFVYVTEFTGGRVQKFTSSGGYVAQWGSPGTGNGQFQNPRGIAVDAAGNVYVADGGNHRIQKFDAAGTFLTKWGSSGTGNGQFDLPSGIAVDPAGNVYVCDTFNMRVQKFTSNGAYLGQWGGHGSGPGEFSLPASIAIDAVGNVYVGDNENDRIQKFTAGGTYLTQWGTTGTGDGQFDNPIAVSVDAEANVYVIDNTCRIQRFSGAGVAESRWPISQAFDLRGPNDDGVFYNPLGIAAATGPYVYVTQTTGLVRCRSFGGATLELFGSFGSGDGQFNHASGVATDAAGNVYVADTQNHRIQKLTADGVFVTKWGSFGTGNGQFNEPAAIALDAAGNVYVVDQVNRRVQKFTSGGAYLGQWGSLGSGNGQFDFPTGIAVDRNGIVYVAEDGNARVQKFTADGVHVGQWPMPLGSTPDDIAVDGFGNVYVPTGNGGNVYRFTTNGLLLNVLNLGPGATSVPSAVGVDPAGSVYIAEGATTRVRKFVTSPSIAFAKDVPADEGGRVTLRIRPASADSPNSGVSVLGYDVYLLSQALSAPAGPGEGTKLNAHLVPATGAASYSVDVATLDDATATALRHGMFMVRAWTGPYSYYDSELHPAMSVDNLAPPVPAPFVVRFAGGNAHLHWDVSPAPDFDTFRLYRGFDPAFVPGPASLLTATSDTGYVDPAQPGFTYKLSAVDEHGNESLFAVVGPSGVVGVPAEPALAFGLEPVWPNPVAAGRPLTVRFTLARAGAARLELVDVAGRRMASRDVDGLGAGAHAVDLAAAGARAAQAGVYFLRLTQGAETAVRRVVVLD